MEWPDRDKKNKGKGEKSYSSKQPTYSKGLSVKFEEYKEELLKEKQLEIRAIQDQMAALIFKIYHLEEMRAVQRSSYENKGDKSAEDLKKISDRIKGIASEIGEIQDRLDELCALESKALKNYELYQKHAEDQVKKTSDLEKTSGKNKLYIGNRQLVADHVRDAKPSKKKQKEYRYLNLGVWTWGINLAWIDGGLAAGAAFKIKLGTGPYNKMPDIAMAAIETKPDMSAKDWENVCKKCPGSMLWHDGEGRLTWTACEISAILSAGYRFYIEPRSAKHQGESKLYLRRPEKPSKQTTDD